MEKAPKANKPSREERGYTAARGKKFTKEDWMGFLHPEKGNAPHDGEEGWARKRGKKK